MTPTVDGLTVEMVHHRVATLTVYRPDGDLTHTVYAAPVTLIVGDAWLTLNPGDRKVIRLPAGVEVRKATEADVLAWTPPES